MENSNVIKQSQILLDAIRDSNEYKTYLECKKEISKNPQLFSDVKEMMRFSFELQNAETSNNMYDEVVKLFDRYAYLRTNIVAARFLRAEMSLCRMAQEIVSVIMEGIDMEMDFLD